MIWRIWIVGTHAALWVGIIVESAPGQGPTGACCQSLSCTAVTAADCTSMVGLYQGDGTTCTPNPCTLGTAFTYQGYLEKPAGTPVDGNCDLRFGLWSAPTGGGQRGESPQTKTAVPITQGSFTISDLDFGAEGINGSPRWLAIEIKCQGDANFTLLDPRVRLNPVPHALALPGLYTQQNATCPNVVGGQPGNLVASGVVGATIAGGGEAFAAVNQVKKDFGTVSGGQLNTASGYVSTVPGGLGNEAGGDYSFAGGRFAKVRNATQVGFGDTDGDQGVFMWADSQFANFTSTGPNQFLIRASGGVGINNNNPVGGALDVSGNGLFSGSVGIGTFIPQAKLDVRGRIEGASLVTISDVATPGNVITVRNDGNGAAIRAQANSNSGEAAVKVFNIGTGYTIYSSARVPVAGVTGYKATQNDVFVCKPSTPERPPEITPEQFATGGGEDIAMASAAVCQNSQAGAMPAGPGGDLPIVGRIMDADDIGVWAAAPNIGAHAVQAHARDGIAVYGSTNYPGFPDGALATNPNAIGVKGYSYAGVALSGESPNGTAGRFLGNVDVSGKLALATPSQLYPLQAGTDATNGNGAHLTPGGVWTNGSDRNSKQSFENIDKLDILHRVADLPVTRWQYKGESERVHHIGPVAQDFYAAFGTGADERYIGTIDADGVALAAIQGLYEIVQEKECEIGELREQKDRELKELKSEISDLRAMVDALIAANQGGER